MSAEEAAAIADAEAQPWTAERKPDITPEMFAMYRASMAMAEAMAAMQAHEGPKRGDAWAERIAAFTEARGVFMAVFESIKGEN